MATAANNMESQHTAPEGGRRATQQVLARIWAEVLRIPQVDPTANFFDLGGDSLKAMDVIVRVSKALSVELPLIAFFEEPTIAHLASVVDEMKSPAATLSRIFAAVLRIPEVDRNANFFDLGGDSLKAMDVIVRVGEALQVELPLVAFFEDPTVTHLAQVIEGLTAAAAGSSSTAALQQIFADVLGVPQVDPNANFFDIGGDSLKAMDVIVRVGEALQVELPLVAFFEDPTVTHLASVVDSISAASAPNAAEEALERIFAEVLGLASVARDANFFDIGGDSLKAMDVIMKAGETLGVELPLVAFFEDPTIAHLATVVGDVQPAAAAAPALLKRVPGRVEFPLAYSQQVFWLLEQQNPGTGIYNTHRIFRMRGQVDAGTLELSLNELVRRHEILRVRFVEGPHGPIQVAGPSEPIKLALADMDEQAAMQRALQIVREPFDLTRGPLLRAQLIRLGAAEYLLAMAIHHVVSDGFTGGIFLDELGAIYEALAAGKPNPLPELQLHFTDYAGWEQQWMQGSRLDQELDYWRPLLQGAPTHVDVPTDLPRVSEPDRRGHLRSATIASPEALARLHSFARSHGTTLFTVLATGMRILLNRWSGQADFLLGTVSSNRSRGGTERMIGCFVNPLPLRNPLAEGQTVLDVLNGEKRAVMDAFAHQDCPFGRIVEAVNPERTSSDNPLFNVALMLQNFPAIEVRNRYFEAERVDFDAHVALLDLRFIGMETRHGLEISCEYKSSLFSDVTIDALLHGFGEVLQSMADNPAQPVSAISLPETLPTRQTIAIAASFTAEPIQEALDYWMKQLGLAATLAFAPFNQVIQQLFDPASLLSANVDGVNVLLVRTEDLSGTDELIAGLRVAAGRAAAPFLVCICPGSAHAPAQDESALAAAMNVIPGVQAITSSELLSLYPVDGYEDEYAWQVAHIPYKAPLFTALATMVARRIYGLRRTQRQVVAVDCGRPEIVRSTREFLTGLEAAGMILCLSGNGGAEAIAAEHIAASRLNDQPHPENLLEMAEELSLDLGSFIFASSDPVACDQMRCSCPDVLVAQLPTAENVPGFLANFWAFDRQFAAPAGQRPLHAVRLSEIAALSSITAITRAIDSAKALRSRGRGADAAPRSPLEEILADMWARLLRVERLGIHDHFFALGGHSLLAAQVVARVRQTLDVGLPLRAVFDAPTVAEFAARVETERRRQTGVIIPPLKRTPREGPLPLSYAQQRLWFIDQLEPGTSLYNTTAMFRMQGRLAVDAMERTINEIVRRHEALRSTFPTLDGQPVQTIAPELRVELPIIDVAGEEAQRLSRELANRPFDLARGPLVRAALLRLSAEDHILLVFVHHIVTDGWSMNVLADEVAALYGAFQLGNPSPLPELAVQYADFAVWQREWLDAEYQQEQVAYWKRQLSGAPALLELPTDRPRPAMQRHRGDTQVLVLPKELIEKLTALSRAEGVTLYMTLLAAFQTLLSRYSGQEDIVVGSPIAGRNYAEIEPLIGFFVSTLALRVDLSGNPSFRELVSRVKDVTLEAYAHQDVPFEKAVEELAPERSLSYNPIFQTVFALQNPLQNIEVSGLQIERALLNAGASLFDISCFAFYVPQGLLLRAQYDTDLFDQATIVRMLDHFQRLLEGVAADAEKAIHDLPMLTAAEERRLRVEWNATAADYPRESCAHELFEEHAALYPGNLAVAFEGRSLTYGELNRRANQLAHHLRGLGVGPDSVVGILLHRSDEMVTAILGAVKAGAAYLPMDPAYPEDRLAFMLNDARAAVLLTDSKLGAGLTSQAAKVCLDTDWEKIGGQPAENPARVANARNLAYVIYTSGSTGRPKGVELEHRSLLNLVTWHQREYDVRPEDRATQIAAPAFDASVWEIWPYLTAGASVHIPGEETRSSPQQLLQWLERERITLSFLPTPLAESVLEEMKQTPASLSLRAMLTGGDKLHQYPDASLTFRLVNQYGPTENTVVATWTTVSPGGQGVPPIGKPISNTRVYILDPYMRPVPVGVSGELYIGGESLARGYRHRPELTADRFVKDPFSDGRLYRTGDRVRYLPDGNIEFLGRLDHQVKIRGFRIELGEIEAVLAQHSGVKECAVTARDDGRGGSRLAAYVVPREEKPATADLRALLEGQLPEYMVPAAFVFLPAFPLTANGKIDTRALPAPEFSADDIAPYVAPRNPSEERLCAIWSEVLRLPQVGIRDNFFVCGGHSLLATQVVSRVRQSTGIELPLRLLFLSPTVEELAAQMEKIRAEHAEDLAPIPRVPRGKPLPVSFAQQRLWFLDQLDPNSALYNAPWAIRLKGELHADALRQALDDIVRRHEIFRTTFTVLDGSPFQVIAPEVELGVTQIDLSGIPAEKQEAEVRRLVIEDASRPFNLVEGPVFRAILMRLNSTDHALLLNTHHISNDGWSIWRFLKELGEAYQAACEGLPCPFEEMPIQYADFASWQRNWLQGEVLDRQVAFWKKHLEGAPDTLELPTDKPRPAVLSYRGAVEKLVLPKSLSDKLKALGRSEDATLYMTLLSAFQTMLFRYTGQEDIVVGSPIANRTRTDIEELIGFFVNTIVMRTDLSGNPTFRELVRRVRDFSLAAYTNQDLPFEKLVEVLRPDRYLGRVPLFQVWFALQNLPRTAFHLPGLELTSMDLHNATSKFDLGLFVADKPDAMVCSIEYSTDLFEATTIRRMLEQYGILLEAIIENWDRPIAKLPMLPAAEEQRLLTEWNDPSRQFARETCIHQTFEQQAARTPGNIAVVFEGRQWDYRELNRRSNQLARRLRALGVGPETLVGICVERSLEMLVAILGVLKAGGGYLPLDPAYPKDRRAFMLEDADVPVLLTQSELLREVPEHRGATICLDTDWHTIEAESGGNLPNLTKPENVAYVIYTSGSTGKPKGVIVTHENVARLFTATDHWFSFGPDDVWTLFHSFAFDFSVWEIWGALLYGGKLVVVPRLIARSPEQFHELLVDQRVTVLNQTPSAFRHLIVADQQSGRSRDLALRYVVFGGEALEFKSLLPWIERHGDTPALINMYGITETTVHVTYFKIDPKAVGDDTVSLVGVPIPDLQVYVLDPNQQPAPIGVPGEMYVGGYGVARGYLKRPELTADRFIPNPFHPDPAAKLYRTGDLARINSDGNIQYLGRIDHQVKIRGFRIELGEIETTLDSHPGVRRSVVIAREDEPGDKRLVAYVVTDPDYRGSDQPESETALSSEQVAQWTEAFDEAYRRGDDATEATFNITGWDSSYTGKPIPAEEMRVWVETTVDRIRDLRPRSVWEIGCGTGLLLFRLAPGRDRYYGTDISQTALGFLRQQLQRPELNLPHLTLERKPAHEFDGTKGRFQAVVINSVSQYFPDFEYFMKVLDGAVESVEPGGAVFVGDLRSFPLLEAFHTSIQLFQAPESLSRSELSQRIQKSLRQEGELLIDPEFFLALRHRLPQISRVEIQLKRGRSHNELTRFRYDVVLHIGHPQVPKVDCAWLDWKKQSLTVDGLREILQKTEPEVLGLAGVPNARLQAEVAALRMLDSDEGPATAGNIRGQLENAAANGIEPEDLWALEQELPYRLEIRSSRVAVDGCFDVVLRRRAADGEVRHDTMPRFPGETDSVRPWLAYANNPLRGRVAGKLVPQLRSWVGAKLPEYMVPSAFVLLDSMPLTANGKVNRRALPAPDQARPEGQAGYTAPRTPAEEIIAAIFADVLRVERVGIEDNFFELGGHSLSATQVVSRIRQAFEVELPVRTLFESPAVRTLAEAVEQLKREESGLLAPPIVPVPRDRALPLSFAQQRLWVHDQMEPDSALYNVPRAIRMKGPLNAAAMEQALAAMVRRHEILRTTYGVEKEQPVQVISRDMKIPLEIVDLTVLPAADREAEARRIVQREADTPFNLAKGPILCPFLIRMEEQDHVLLLNTHHIASDGWSNGVFSRDLAALYEAALEGRPAALPELPIQYADYAVWQRNWLQGEVLDRQLGYWKDRLEGAPPVLALPTDRPRPAIQTFRGAMEFAQLPKSLADSLDSLSRQEGATLFMSMLAAFQTLVMYYVKHPDIVLGTDLAGRNNVQTENLIGFFVNLLVLRTDLSGDPTFQELIERVRETALGAYTHQDVPFEKLVEELRPERALGHNPLVQVLFVQQTAAPAFTMPGLELSNFRMDLPSKFDLAVFVRPSEKGIAHNWVYNPDFFDATTMTRMAGLYQTVLEKAVANPEIRLSGLLQALTESEQQQRASDHQQFQAASLQKLKTIKRKAISGV